MKLKIFRALLSLICMTISIATSNILNPIKLLKSVFGESRPNTVIFDYSHIYPNETRNFSINQRVITLLPNTTEYNITAEKTRYLYQEHKINLTKLVLDDAGIKTTTDASRAVLIFQRKAINSNKKNKTYRANKENYSNKGKYTKHYRIPHFNTVFNKEAEWTNYSRMRSRFPNEFNYMRETYVMPMDKERFLEEKIRNPGKIWVSKVKNIDNQIGVSLLEDTKASLQKALNKNMVISDYLVNPLLFNNRKFDIRTYFLVTSISPLRVYMYKESFFKVGMKEFSMDKDSFSDTRIHLPSKGFVNKDREGEYEEGYMLSLRELSSLLKEKGGSYEELWEQMKDIKLKALFTHINSLSFKKQFARDNGGFNNIFDFFASDFLLEENLKPWLIELNLLPTLDSFTKQDHYIKYKAIADKLTLVGLSPFEGQENDIKRTKTNKKECEEDSSKNCDIEVMSENDKADMLMYSIDEFSRQGGYERVFPVKETLDKYSGLYDNPSEHDRLLWRWLREPKEVEMEYNISRKYGVDTDI